MAARKNGKLVVKRIVSGGQTGVDRGALDAAIALGIEHGGWCPRGRRAEDGPIAAKYQLTETRSSQYRQRTEKNVLDSDGTLILFQGTLSGGTELTRRLTLSHHKPHLLIDLTQPPDVSVIRQWLITEAIRVLNVAGPRESSAPGIADRSRTMLQEIFAQKVRERPGTRHRY